MKNYNLHISVLAWLKGAKPSFASLVAQLRSVSLKLCSNSTQFRSIPIKFCWNSTKFFSNFAKFHSNFAQILFEFHSVPLKLFSNFTQTITRIIELELSENDNLWKVFWLHSAKPNILFLAILTQNFISIWSIKTILLYQIVKIEAQRVMITRNLKYKDVPT